MRTTFRHCVVVGSALFISVSAYQILQAQGYVEGTFQRTLTISGSLTELEATTGSGRIEVRSGPAGRVEVQAQVRVSERGRGRQEAEELLRQLQTNPPIEQVGNVVRVGLIQDPDARQNVSISYTITVPPETRLRSHTGSGGQFVDGIAGPVEVSSGSGGLTISNIQSGARVRTGSGTIRMSNVASDVTANTGSGGIVAEGIAGGFSGRTGSGSIRLTQTATGDVEAFTGSGGVELNGVRGMVRVRTGSGGIAVEGQPTGSWDLTAGSGSVVVRLPQQTAFNVNAHTGSGGITVEHPVTVQGRLRRNELVGTVRGGGFELGVRTASGSIRIE